MTAELDGLVAAFAARDRNPDAPVDEQRLGYDLMGRMIPLVDATAVEPVNAGGVPAEWITAPGAEADKVVVHFHAGGYVIGSLDSHRPFASRLSAAAGCRVLLVDYRRAPEHPFPAALDDALTACRWVIGEGASSDHLVISGDSAGGGLTIAALCSLRDAGEGRPAAAVAMSPWVDLARTGASVHAKADLDPILSPDLLERWAGFYLAGADPRAPAASPLYADLAGLPPLLILAGGREVLLDDAVRLAERARTSGVDVTLEVADEMIHIWPSFAGLVPEGDEGVARVGAFIRAHI